MKVVQIGLGHDHATQIFDSMLRQKDIFDVVGFAVPESEEIDFVERITKYRDELKIPKLTVEEALSSQDLEGAVIETEEVNLTRYALMAAEKGLHIHMDKPGGIGLKNFERLIQKVTEKKLAFSLGYMYRFNPKIQEALDKIKNGNIGEVYCVEAHMDCIHTPQKRQWLEHFPGGMMFYLGCHLVDLIFRIQGEPQRVLPLNCATGFDGVSAKDYAMAIFQYPRGISFVKSCANEYGGFLRRQLVICGSKGTIEINPLEIFVDDSQYTLMKETISADWHLPGKETKTERYNRYDSMMKNYYDIACTEKGNLYTYEYELTLYKLLLSACGEENE